MIYWQLGISKFSREKEYYGNYDYKIGKPSNDPSKFYDPKYNKRFGELRYAFECFATFKYKTKIENLSVLILQATFGFERPKMNL